MSRFTEAALRIFGGLTALVGIAYGGLILGIFFFVGQASGFADTRFSLKYLALALYVLVTIYVAVRLALRASKRRGVLLGCLVLPYLVFAVVASGQVE